MHCAIIIGWSAVYTTVMAAEWFADMGIWGMGAIAPVILATSVTWAILEAERFHATPLQAESIIGMA
jgi:hypothetical protein